MGFVRREAEIKHKAQGKKMSTIKRKRKGLISLVKKRKKKKKELIKIQAG